MLCAILQEEEEEKVEQEAHNEQEEDEDAGSETDGSADVDEDTDAADYLEVSRRTALPLEYLHSVQFRCEMGDCIWCLVDISQVLWRRSKVVGLNPQYVLLRFYGEFICLALHAHSKRNICNILGIPSVACAACYNLFY